MIHAEVPAIEITAPPERVRELVLDFAGMPSWHTQHFKSITVTSGKQPKDLVEGDKLHVVLTPGLTFSPVILENSPTQLRWRGSLPGVFTGNHVFAFHPSETTPGGTRFVQYEDFSGVLAFTMKPEKRSGMTNLEGFAAFNRDLKKKAEEDGSVA